MSAASHEDIYTGYLIQCTAILVRDWKGNKVLGHLSPMNEPTLGKDTIYGNLATQYADFKRLIKDSIDSSKPLDIYINTPSPLAEGGAEIRSIISQLDREYLQNTKNQVWMVGRNAPINLKPVYDKSKKAWSYSVDYTQGVIYTKDNDPILGGNWYRATDVDGHDREEIVISDQNIYGSKNWAWFQASPPQPTTTEPHSTALPSTVDPKDLVLDNSRG